MPKLTPSVPSGLSGRRLPVRRSLPAALPLRGRWLSGLRVAFCLLALSWQAACGGRVEFDLSQDIADQRVVGSPGGGALTTFLPTPVVVGLDVKQAAVNQNAKGPVSSVTLAAMNFQIGSVGVPATGDSTFDFVQSASVYVESTRPNSSLGRELVATLGIPPGKTVTVGLEPVPGKNLLSFLSEGARFTASGTGTLPAKDVVFTGSFTVHVKTL